MDRRARGERIGPEHSVFFGLGLLLLIASVAAEVFKSRLHGASPRIQYGMEHLPAALLSSLLFLLLAAGAQWAVARFRRLEGLPAAFFVAAVIAAFCLFWLPAVLAGGFDKDDWMLLGAASVRKTLAGHPGLAWYTLDSVDGNFRPLGTVLYIGVMLRHFGVWARPFLLGLFAVNLAGTLVAFAIVRALGYSRVAAAAGAILYLSRSETYTIMTWTCALGDALAILLCGLMALSLLAAIRKRGWTAAGFHVLAWLCFCLATLAKQSAFAAPLIVALLLLLRPGTAGRLPLARRLRDAALGLAVYAATAAVPFLHAKRLLASPSPYPIGFSSDALLRVFGYAIWYLGTFEFPTKYAGLQMLPYVAGIAIVCVVVIALWRLPSLLGDRPRDIVFCLLAGVASVSLFTVLPGRIAPYYGSMAAFWVSIAFGTALTRFGQSERQSLSARLCRFVFCALVVVGFVDVRLKQTGLLPAGGYTWGASEVGTERTIYESIARKLAAAPETSVLLLEDMPDYDGVFAGMAMTADPKLQRILTRRSGSASFLANSFLANDREGVVPPDDPASLRDPQAFNWNVPMDHARAESLLARSNVLRLKFHDGKIESGN